MAQEQRTHLESDKGLNPLKLLKERHVLIAQRLFKSVESVKINLQLLYAPSEHLSLAFHIGAAVPVSV